MAQSVKLSDGCYIDTEGIYDVTQGKTQADVNAGILHIKSFEVEGVTDSSGEIYISFLYGKIALRLTATPNPYAGMSGYLCFWRDSARYVVRHPTTMAALASTNVKISGVYLDTE